jgi:hypothetical protein
MVFVAFDMAGCEFIVRHRVDEKDGRAGSCGELAAEIMIEVGR